MSVVDGGIGRHRRIGKADLAGRDRVVSVGESSKGVCSVAVGSGGGRSSTAECDGGPSSTRPGDGAGDGVGLDCRAKVNAGEVCPANRDGSRGWANDESRAGG